MLSTRQLRYFDALARHQHFGRAAEHCGVSQPALSMQISELEATLGIALIERRARGIVLTETGREIARRAANVLQDLRDMSSYAAECQAVLSAPLRLGVIPTIAPYMLPRLLLMLRDQHPDLLLQIRESQTQVLVEELASGALDLLVLALPVERADLTTKALRADRFLLAVPPDHPVAKRARISAELIRDQRLLLLEEGHCLRDQALAVCDLRPSGRADTFGASSLATVVQMVAAGLGLTLLPEIAVAQETARSDVRLLRFAEPEPKRTLGLAWRKTSARQRDFKALGRLIQQALEPRAA
jgi:LysR family hydrogen peroxide-inducible transcriptional activator